MDETKLLIILNIILTTLVMVLIDYKSNKK
jgi:hypothetical protein